MLSKCYKRYFCRPGSQQSGSSKRKNSPKFHFLKNRRKNLVPAKREREEKEDDNASLNVRALFLKTFPLTLPFRRMRVARRTWSLLNRQ